MKGSRLIYGLLASVLRVDAYKDCNDWAWHNRRLPKENAEPGRFNIDRTPYFKAVGEALSNPKFTVVSVMCATQMAKTELCFNFLGYRFDTRAQPSIFVFPTQKLAENVSQTRFSKLLESSKSLYLKHKKGKNDKITLKIINGAPLIFAHASSANQLCSHACATAVLDEYDRMPENVEGEGSPLELVLSRLATFPNKKALVTSTPTILDISPIVKLQKEGIDVSYYVKCPHCDKFILPCFDVFKWDNDDYQKVKRAWLECAECKEKIYDHHRDFLLLPENGDYFHKDKRTGKLIHWKKITNNKTASFWVSGLVSPWRDFLDCAIRWLKAVSSGSELRKQSVINTVFGEPYDNTGISPEPEKVLECRLDYKKGTLKRAFSDVIIMTVDVQQDCLYYVIRGWSTTSKSALIDYGFIYGDTNKTKVWKKLYKLSLKKWGKYPINYTFIDCNYRPHKVYDFCKRYGITKYFPIRGKDKLSAPVRVYRVEIKKDGKSIRLGLKVFSIIDGYFKDSLYGRINESKSWFVPFDIEEEYCKQVTSETVITKGNKQIWTQKYKHNHYLDCEKYQIAASVIFRIDLEGETENENLSEEETSEVIEDTYEEIIEKVETKVVKKIHEIENKHDKTNVLKNLKSPDNIGLNVWS